MFLKIAGYSIIGFGLISLCVASYINAFTKAIGKYDNAWGAIISGCLLVLASPE